MTREIELEDPECTVCFGAGYLLITTGIDRKVVRKTCSECSGTGKVPDLELEEE